MSNLSVSSYIDNGAQTSVRPLTEHEWTTLLGRIKKGECTPFLGAGINEGLLPLGGKIASDWATQHDYPLEDRSNLASVAQYMAITGGDKMFPKERIAELLMQPPLPVFAQSHPLAFLATLPIKVYLTTNYDDYLFHALRQNHRLHAKVEMCAWNTTVRGRSAVLYEEPTPQNPTTARARHIGFGPSAFSVRTFVPSVHSPVIYHLHGHQNSVDSMVLTENDYLEFLVNMSREPKLLPACIKEAFTGTSLLFLGYSLHDYNFRVLFRGLIRSLADNVRLSVSIQLPREDQKVLKYLDQYFEDFNIRVFWGTADQFIDQLRTRWANFNS